MRSHRRMILSILLASAGIGALLWARASRVDEHLGVDSSKKSVVECDDDDDGDPFGWIQLIIDKLRADLKLNDDLEFELVFQALKGKAKDGPQTFTIVLIRPDEIQESRETYEVRNDDQGAVIKMVKVRTKRIVGPVAFITEAAVVEGKLVTEQMVLRYGEDGRWAEFSPSK